ncbi:MAG: hypothetical protein LBT79_04470 [Elusimicrobiota bacterium]|jgi:hypothetical protein|nr:hypothetical protein [Elusimicrobiota bacterium]
MLIRPKIFDSPYVYKDDIADPKTQAYIHLKPDAPLEVQKEFNEWRLSEIESQKCKIHQ